MSKSDPHAALQRFTEEHITLQNQIKFNVVTFLKINFCEKIIFCLEKVSYVSTGREIETAEPTIGGWQMSFFVPH